jgi:hypothetical protein
MVGGAVLAGVLLGLSVMEAGANFVPGKGGQPRNPTVSMDFDQPVGFVPNFPRSTMHIDGEGRMPLAYSTNLYVNPLGGWSHSIDGGATSVNTNVFNYLVEDGWRGCPSVMDWTTSPAIGAGALRLATSLDGSSTSDALSFNMLPASAGNVSYFPAAVRASTIARVYVPDPSTWQPDGNYPFLFMSMVGEPGDWPCIYCQKYGATYTWECDNQAYGGDYIPSNYTNFPHMQITGPGWWTVGVSMDEDGGVNYYVRSGLVTLTAADYCGTYRYNIFTNNYGLFGTFYVRNTSVTVSPDWIVDQVEYFHTPPPHGSLVGLR